MDRAIEGLPQGFLSRRGEQDDRDAHAFHQSDVLKNLMQRHLVRLIYPCTVILALAVTATVDKAWAYYSG
jgi:hypothetical protein